MFPIWLYIALGALALVVFLAVVLPRLKSDRRAGPPAIVRKPRAPEFVLMHTLRGHTARVFSVAFHPEGNSSHQEVTTRP